jgi:Asp-tRNA(Asn)/Glu-tRNA(Gln) amidotransferase A subunit family amidase
VTSIENSTPIGTCACRMASGWSARRRRRPETPWQTALADQRGRGAASSERAHNARRGSDRRASEPVRAARRVTSRPSPFAPPASVDRERAQGRLRGPLHGIPVALKDNIHTTDLPTTGGALAFAGYVRPYEATLTVNLRDAGAIIIAKNRTDGAGQLGGRRAEADAGNYNAVGGFAFNPYDPRPRANTRGDGRCGGSCSSSTC